MGGATSDGAVGSIDRQTRGTNNRLLRHLAVHSALHILTYYILVAINYYYYLFLVRTVVHTIVFTALYS